MYIDVYVLDVYNHESNLLLAQSLCGITHTLEHLIEVSCTQVFELP